MAFLLQKFPHALGARLHVRHGQRSAWRQFRQLNQLRVAILRVVDQIDLRQAHPRARIDVRDDINLMRRFIRLLGCRNLGLIQTFVAKQVPQAVQRFIHVLGMIGLPQRELHGGDCRSLGGWSFQALDPHLADKQVFPRDEVEPNPAIFRARHRAQIGIVAGAIKNADALCHLVGLQRFTDLDGNAFGFIDEHLPMLVDHADVNDLGAGKCLGWRRRIRLGLGKRAPCPQ